MTDPLTFFIRDDGHVAIVCPACSYSKDIDAALCNTGKKKLKVRCPCGYVFEFFIEPRQFYRKPVNLAGEVVDSMTGFRAPIVINNLSVEGIRFVCTSAGAIRSGSQLTLSFHLDDARRTLIKKKIVIKWIDNDAVGAQFTDANYRPELGFYLGF